MSPRFLLRALGVSFSELPIATAVYVGVIPVGLIFMVLGEGASRAFEEIGGAIIPHLVGMLLILGGGLATAGIVRLGLLVQMLGLVLIAAGTFLYGIGVVLGLGWSGSVAAGLSWILTVGTGGRVFVVLKKAKEQGELR